MRLLTSFIYFATIVCTLTNVCLAGDLDTLKLKEPDGIDDLTYQEIWKPFGPAQVRNQSALKLSALEWLPDNPDTLSVGSYRTDFAITYANHWGEMKNYFLDLETARFELRFAFGVSDKLDFQLTYSGFWRGGGILDGYIENFHSLIGETQSRRDDYPRDVMSFLLHPNDPDTIYVMTNNDAGFGTGDLTFRLRYQVIAPKFNYRPALTVSLTTKVPVGNADDYFTARAFEFCGHFMLRQRLHKLLFAYLAGGVTYTSADKIWEVEVNPYRWFFFIGGEWHFDFRWSINLQYELETGIARYLDYQKMLAWATNLITLAFQWRPDINRDYYFEFAMIENFVFHSNTPDITFHVAFKWLYN